MQRNWPRQQKIQPGDKGSTLPFTGWLLATSFIAAQGVHRSSGALACHSPSGIQFDAILLSAERVTYIGDWRSLFVKKFWRSCKDTCAFNRRTFGLNLEKVDELSYTLIDISSVFEGWICRSQIPTQDSSIIWQGVRSGGFDRVAGQICSSNENCSIGFRSFADWQQRMAQIWC